MGDQLFLTIRTAIRSLAGCFWAYMVFRAIGLVAGQSTSVIVHATLNAFGELKVVVPTGVAAAAGVGWYRERKLRHKNTEHMAHRIERLEKNVDPKRTSSKLTKQGRTNPVDREA